MIEIENIAKRFGHIEAVAGLSLTAKKGEVVGLLGPNGAGKSTTMKMATGYLSPDAGTVRICGHDIVTDTLTAQSALGYLPEGAPAYGDMTVRGFLKFIAEIRGLSGRKARTKIGAAAERTELTSVFAQPIETLSKGFKRRVGLAQAILHDPPVLILDEPTDGLDPNQKHAVRSLIRTMSADKTIIISTHILEEVEAICSRMAVIDRGRLVADGTPEKFLARSRYHNAVSVVLTRPDAPAIAEKLKSVAAVTDVERSELPGERVCLTAFAAPEHRLIEEISARALKEAWPLKELYAEPGRLDDVFRALTSRDVPAAAKAAPSDTDASEENAA